MPFSMFGEDWSAGNLKNKLGGLLTDPQKQQALLGSPAFGAGMGLLSSRYDASVNPFQAAVEGMAGAKKQSQSDEDRERLQQLRDALGQMILQQGGGQVPGRPSVAGGVPPVAGMPPPTPTEQSRMQSLMPGMPGSSLQPTMPGVQPMSETDMLLRRLGVQGIYGGR